ncbi:IclR family transcriptional regulator [Amycolatopsis taiwanensis]|uniref:IclR family transcriptional regulator n=1 Tax=Amycolatopsis taiwanensis TaxID=342230 RepID=A0A9W6R772_9PSEU|nr:IclR family transcriptional regulator [Amycolatopsis taiwanensis]GLY68802.1 IclR family transcriptional regulator [Amycolatopsis taiwanensis]
MSQAVERAIQILEMLTIGPQHPNAVAERFGVHRTTALRLLQDLCQGGLARKREDGTFAVGYRLAGLAQAALDQFDLRGVAHPHLAELGRKLRLTVHIATVDDGRVIYVDKIEPPGTIRLYSQIGKPVVLHTSGVGKTILAFMPEDERAQLLRGYDYQRFTDATITTAEGFAARLREIRERGWGEDDGEYESYVNCVAVPVRDGTSAVRTAISVTALKAQIDLAGLRQHLPAIRNAAQAISRALGWTS